MPAIASDYRRVLLVDPAGTAIVTTGGGVPIARPITVTGNIAALNDTVEMDFSTGSRDNSGAAISIQGTWTGTITYEVSYDGTNYSTASGLSAPNPSTGLFGSTTANRTVVFACGGVQKIRARASAAMTGTANVTIIGTPLPGTRGVYTMIATADQPILSTSSMADGSSGSQILPSANWLKNAAGTFDQQRSFTGTINNAWISSGNGAAVAVGGTSNSIDLGLFQTVSVLGSTVSVVTGLIRVQLSQDNATFIDSEKTFALQAGGSFGGSFDIGARFIRLKSEFSATAVLNTTIAAKGV